MARIRKSSPATLSVTSPAIAFNNGRRRKKPLVIFFLDLDDVLITHRAAHGIGPGAGLFTTIDPVAMGMFNRLAEKVEKQHNADVRVVLISAKRDKRGIRQYLQKNGLTVKFHHHYKTGRGGQLRGNEVDRWLIAHPYVRDYQIFDDASDFLRKQKSRHVRCQLYNGMTYQNYVQCRDYFRKAKYD